MRSRAKRNKKKSWLTFGVVKIELTRDVGLFPSFTWRGEIEPATTRMGFKKESEEWDWEFPKISWVVKQLSKEWIAQERLFLIFLSFLSGFPHPKQLFGFCYPVLEQGYLLWASQMKETALQNGPKKHCIAKKNVPVGYSQKEWKTTAILWAITVKIWKIPEKL